MNATEPGHPTAGEAPGWPVPATVDEWLAQLAARGGAFGGLLSRSVEEQSRLGYAHTLREIAQQPLTWLETSEQLCAHLPGMADSLAGVSSVVFTGSGSSVYAAECAAPGLQRALGLPVSAVPAGLILTHPETCLPPSGRFLVVSLARSGNSPESRAVVDWLLEARPQARHLFITCNREGALATSYAHRPEVRTIVLDEKTNDRSLVMTSSFTNLVLAGRALGGTPQDGGARARGLARAAARLLRDETDALSAVARSGFGSALFLGSGSRLGSAREAALKLLEMNGGEVFTYAESYLGLRHGPMSAIRANTLVVAFLSSDPMVRAYERDLLRELDKKALGARRVVVGDSVPQDLAALPGSVALECATPGCADDDLTLIDALVGQLLAFFRCLDAGYHPDSPSETSVITRVVSGFEIHRRDGAR
jgi:tagatose-6-phosphate ketose/aldose isomerase